MLRPSPWMWALTLTVAACGTKPVVANTTLTEPKFAKALDGNWADEGGTEHTFQRDGQVVRVVEIVDVDDEVFQVTNAGQLLPQGFTWTYLVPSTGFEVTHTITAVEGVTFQATWTNQEATGKSTFVRN